MLIFNYSSSPYHLYHLLLIWCSSTYSERPPRNTRGFFGLPPPWSLFCLEERALAAALSREAEPLDLDLDDLDPRPLALPLSLLLLPLLLGLLSFRLLVLRLALDLLKLRLSSAFLAPRLTLELDTSTLFNPPPKILVLWICLLLLRKIHL